MSKIYFYCENCFDVTEIDVSGIIKEIEKIPEFKETSSSVIFNGIHCSHCNSMATFEIDEYSIPVVKLANEKGYRTRFCCSGHYTVSPLGGDIDTLPYIVIECTPEEKEIISQLDYDETYLLVDIEDDQMIINGETVYSETTVNIYYRDIPETKEEIIEACNKMCELISNFPDSCYFEKGSYST